MCCAVSIAEFARRLPSAGSLYTCHWPAWPDLGIGTSSWVDLAPVAERMAVIAALAVSVLVKVGPGGRSLMDLLPLTALAGLR